MTPEDIDSGAWTFIVKVDASKSFPLRTGFGCCGGGRDVENRNTYPPGKVTPATDTVDEALAELERQWLEAVR